MHRLFVICVALAACTDHDVDRMAKVRDELCQCKTVKCAEAALERVPKQDIKSNPRTQKIAREMLDCLAEVYQSNAPTQDPDAPSAPETSDPASPGKP